MFGAGESAGYLQGGGACSETAKQAGWDSLNSLFEKWPSFGHLFES